MAGRAFARDDSNDRKENAARTACLSGDYAKGVAMLSELFVATKDPVYIYNQGRCFEQNSRYEEAVARFQEFLRVGRKMAKAEKAEAAKHIADCKNLLTKQAGPSAGATDTKEAKERAARKACLSGNADKGSEILSDLYLDDKNPTHIYNLGRCYEQNHRYEDAVSRFREYLLKAHNLTADDRTETESHIATCLAYLGKSQSPQTKESPSRELPASRTRIAKEIQDEAAAPIVTPTVVEGPTDASSLGVSDRRSASPRKHRRQPGLFLHFERVLVPGVSYGIVDGLELQAGPMIGYYSGGWLGLRYLWFNGGIKPGLGLGMPVFVVDRKAVVGVQGNAIVQWDLGTHVGLYASIGLAYFPNPRRIWARFGSCLELAHRCAYEDEPDQVDTSIDCDARLARKLAGARGFSAKDRSEHVVGKRKRSTKLRQHVYLCARPTRHQASRGGRSTPLSGDGQLDVH